MKTSCGLKSPLDNKDELEESALVSAVTGNEPQAANNLLRSFIETSNLEPVIKL